MTLLNELRVDLENRPIVFISVYNKKYSGLVLDLDPNSGHGEILKSITGP